MTNIKTILDDLKSVLKEAKGMGCKEVTAFRNVPLENVEIIITALEKQIQKKPDKGGNDKYQGDIRICPICGGIVGVDDDSAHYCADYGQKLDWN